MEECRGICLRLDERENPEKSLRLSSLPMAHPASSSQDPGPVPVVPEARCRRVATLNPHHSWKGGPFVCSHCYGLESNKNAGENTLYRKASFLYSN